MRHRDHRFRDGRLDAGLRRARIGCPRRGGRAGDFLPREWENWSPEDVHLRGRYKNAEDWYDAGGVAFSPGVYYYVGGNTKVYGASLPRFREADFGAIEHPDGTSAAWPVSYADMEPFYARAEQLYGVHGKRGTDPTEPWRSGEYPFPPLHHEPAIATLADAFARQGVRPFVMPTSIDRRPGGRCIRCRTCDGFPCMVDAKGDAEVRAILPATKAGVHLLTRTRVTRLHTEPGGRRVRCAAAERDGRPLRIRAGRFVLGCGAVNTAALLLASGERDGGLANRSGQVGRNYLVHNSTFMMGVDPRRRNDVRFQKTLGVNDFYLAEASRPPLGNVQMLGKLQGAMVKPARPRVPIALLEYITQHSIDLYLTTEDVPTPASFISLSGRRIVVNWRPTKLTSHKDSCSSLQARPRRRLSARVDRADGHRHQLASVRDGPDGRGPGHERRWPGLPQPRPREPVDRGRIDISLLGGDQPGADRGGQRAARRG